jgi:hypothetical protein
LDPAYGMHHASNRAIPSAARVTADYYEVALLHSKGESSWTDEKQMMASQRSKAAELGANGIILGDIREPNAGTKILGSLLGTGAERQGKARMLDLVVAARELRRAIAPPD